MINQPMTWRSHFRMGCFSNFFFFMQRELNMFHSLNCAYHKSNGCLTVPFKFLQKDSICFACGLIFTLNILVLYLWLIVLLCKDCRSLSDLLAGRMQRFASEDQRWLAQDALCCKCSFWIALDLSVNIIRFLACWETWMCSFFFFLFLFFLHRN